jgi:hypothetical protein
MEHAWCHDPGGDAAVRAAEDGRTGPLPTLGEAIARPFGFDKASAQRACDEVKSWPEDVQKDCRFVLGDLLEQGVERLQALVEAWRYGKGLLEARYPDMIPKSVSASSAVEQENKGDGMATKAEKLAYYRAEAIARPFADAAKLAPDANADGEANQAAQAASGGGEESKEVKNDPTIGQMIEDTCKQLATAMRVADIEKRRGDNLHSRVKELEAASGGGEGEPVAYFVKWADKDWGVQDQTFRTLERAQDYIKDEKSEDENPQIVPLYSAPPQPRGWLSQEERQLLESFRGERINTSRDIVMIDALLARSSPPEVVKPFVDPALPRIVYGRDSEWIAALAAAGVAVKEVGSE